MTANEIAGDIVNGNLSDARAAMQIGRSKRRCIVLACDVIYALSDSHLMTMPAAVERVRRLMRD